MNKLLASLVLSVISSVVLAAEPIVHNGVEGVFIEKAKAEELLSIAKQYPSLQEQNRLYELKIEKLMQYSDIKERRLETEIEISAYWQKAFESATKDVSNEMDKDEIRTYIYVGVFVGGIIIGSSIMYGASYLVKNIK